MNHLFRELAPVSDAAWEEIENEAKRTLKTMLAGRKLVDFAGPEGWGASAVGIGRTERIAAPTADAVDARLRRVLPFVELRVPFEMAREELDALDRGAKDFDTQPVIQAARRIAIAEDHAIFHGYPAAGIRGICQADDEAPLRLPSDFDDYPEQITLALNRLRNRGVGGPYAVALSAVCYTGLTEATKDGYPVMQHVRRLFDGPILWAPGLEGAVVLSMRGEDFELTVGQDFSIGYSNHDTEVVRLYLEESFTFWNVTPEAAVHLPESAAEPPQ